MYRFVIKLTSFFIRDLHLCCGGDVILSFFIFGF